MAVVYGGVAAGRAKMIVSGASCSWCSRPSLSLHRRSKILASSAASFLLASPNSTLCQGFSSSLRLAYCRAAKQQQQREGSTRKRGGGKRKVSEKPPSREPLVEVVPNSSGPAAGRNASFPLPKPPAGFVVDPVGKVLLASPRRIATIFDSTSSFPLECVIRRVFESSRGQECMLLCPVDTPVQILKSSNFSGWEAVSDEEVEAILPAAAFALAKIHMHLVFSGFCYTARGRFCYSEDDILEFRTDDGEDIDGLPTEGIDITCFHQDGTHYMIYTPSDPLLFVAVKDQDGQLQIADDFLLDDPAVVGAIDEETEFNALVEEEAALLDSVIGAE
ncbi:BTB/POZ domain protein TNFAIP protein [Wolffia australiana]